jgi:HEAT repeat protein
VVGVRSYAVASAELFGTSEPDAADAAFVLSAILFNDRSPTVRAAAANGLEILGHPDGIGALESALDTEENGLTSAAIEIALGNLRFKVGAP